MSSIINTFIYLSTKYGYFYKKRKLEDGQWLHYAEKSMGSWSKMISCFNCAEEFSLAAGLEVPLIDQVSDLLFPRVYIRNRVEYRIYHSNTARKNLLTLETLHNKFFEECDDNLSKFKKPGDLAIFFASRESRRKTPNPDWNHVSKPWIAITYLGKGKEAARLALEEEIRITRTFDKGKILDCAIQFLLLHRSPRGVFKQAEELSKALTRISEIDIKSLEHNPSDFAYSEITVER